MKVIKGHLTAMERAFIKQMIAQQITKARSQRKYFELSGLSGEITVTRIQRDRGLGFIGNKLQTSVEHFTIEI
jgi:hypothetical protein